MEVVHGTSFLSESDVQILCNKLWTYPWAYGTEIYEKDPEILRSQDNIRYTSEKDKVTCTKCKAKL